MKKTHLLYLAGGLAVLWYASHYQAPAAVAQAPTDNFGYPDTMAAAKANNGIMQSANMLGATGSEFRGGASFGQSNGQW
jgi:hypothetical protein